jgi:hypothetical protein
LQAASAAQRLDPPDSAPSEHIEGKDPHLHSGFITKPSQEAREMVVRLEAPDLLELADTLRQTAQSLNDCAQSLRQATVDIIQAHEAPRTGPQ